MNPAYEKLLKCYDSYKAKIDFTPKVALILGSGLGDYADDIRVVDTLDYHDIEGFPVSTVPGHKGRFIFGYVDDVPVVCMQGRVHYYEGYEMSDVVLPTRLMKMMGAEVLFLTNAAGGIQLGMHAGDFMLIKDQIASFVPSPLRGANIEELGVRFLYGLFLRLCLFGYSFFFGFRRFRLLGFLCLFCHFVPPFSINSALSLCLGFKYIIQLNL